MSNGFNLLSLKKVENHASKITYKTHLVIGEDLFSVALYHELRKKFGADNVAWICPKPITEKDLLPLGPNTLRGKENIETFKRLYPDVEVTEVEKDSEFFKELKWRPFGGRAKSETLLWDEEFFTKQRAEFDIFALFPFLKEEGLYELLEESRVDCGVKEVLKVTPDDLAEPANFEITLTTSDIYKCKELYWGYGPQHFLDLYGNKNALSDDFISFCESTKTPSALYLQAVFKREVTDKRETLFIPLSYTHEWGHFVGEFNDFKDGEQVANFVTFMDMSETNEEEISRKIRLFKKNLEKIFSENSLSFDGDLKEEFIKITDNSPCRKIDDTVYKNQGEEWGNLKMVSVNAPFEHFSEKNDSFEDSVCELGYLSRAAKRHQEVFSSLS